MTRRWESTRTAPVQQVYSTCTACVQHLYRTRMYRMSSVLVLAAAILFLLLAPLSARAEGGDATGAGVDLALERCAPSLLNDRKTDASGMTRLARSWQLVYMRGQSGTAWASPEPGVALLTYNQAPVCQVLILFAEPERMLALLAGRLEGGEFTLTDRQSGDQGWRTDWTAERADGTKILLTATATPEPPGPPTPQAVMTFAVVPEE